MMRKFSYFTMLIAALFVASCSGDEGFIVDPANTNIGGVIGGPTAASVIALTSSPSLPSDAGKSVDITVIVRDANNVVIEDVPVVMSSDSGILTVADPLTNASGVVTATLSAGGDPTNRTINVTADADGATDMVAIAVIGTTIDITGAASLAQSATAPYTILLQDDGGNGIANQVVDITSSNGNTLSAAQLTTNFSGQVQVDLTAANGGTDTLTATALGISDTWDVVVSSDSFDMSAPLADAQIILNVQATVTVNWSINGAPQVGQLINFSASRGSFVGGISSAATDAQGNASVQIMSTDAGPALITATNPVQTSTGVQVEFVADTPAVIDVQASPFTVGPNEQSTITAIVRDANNNLVTGANVDFTLNDTTGGQLSVATAQTLTNGVATALYTSTSTTSANGGVVVNATVQGTMISNSVALTVAQREVFMSLGTGNTVFEPNTATYRKEYIVLVTDSQGNGVENVPVQVGVLSDKYHKGIWSNTANPLIAWVRQPSIPGGCDDEDDNRNGVLDPGEDDNLSTRIEAGNIATAAPQNGSGGGSFVTDSTGAGIVDVLYPQEYAGWVEVTLEATTSVQGTETATASTFVLVGSAEDFDDKDEAPPGQFSPFGVSNTCLDTN